MTLGCMTASFGECYHRRSLRTLGLAGALALGSVLSACTTGCPLGPACDEDWAGGRVEVYGGQRLWTRLAEARDLDPEGGATIASDDDARETLSGDTAAGSDWVAILAGQALFVGQPDASRVVRYAREGRDWTADRTFTGVGRFGTSMVVADFDGDGEVDLAGGAPYDELERGTVWVFRSALGDGVDVPDHILLGPDEGSLFGTRLAACADVRGADGAIELGVGIPWYTAPGGLEAAGAVALVDQAGLLDGGGVSAVAASRYGTEEGAGFGDALLCDSDLSGDGVNDLVVGAPRADVEGLRDAGRVSVYAGGEAFEAGPEEIGRWASINGSSEDDWAGSALASIDLDQDLFGDLAVGAPGAQSARGEVLIHQGSRIVARPDGPPAVVQFQAPDVAEGVRGPRFGAMLASGDLNGDGLPELVAGAPNWRSGRALSGFHTGRLWIFDGSRAASWIGQGTPDDLWDLRVVGERPHHRVGQWASVGNYDGLGTGELIITTRAAPR